MGHELLLPGGKTFVKKEFPDFLKLLGNMKPRTVLVRVVGDEYVDLNEDPVLVTEYSCYTPDERKGLYVERAVQGEELVKIEQRIAKLRRTFPQVVVAVIGRPSDKQ